MEQEPKFEEEKYQDWKAPETGNTQETANPAQVQYVDGQRQVLQGLTAKENGAYMYAEQKVTDVDGKYFVPSGQSLRDPTTGRTSADMLRELTPEETAQHLEAIGQKPNSAQTIEAPKVTNPEPNNNSRRDLYESANQRWAENRTPQDSPEVVSATSSLTPETQSIEVAPTAPEQSSLVETSREVTTNLQSISESLAPDQAEGLNTSVTQIEQLLNSPDTKPIDISRAVDGLGRAVDKLTPEGINYDQDDPKEVASRLDKQKIDSIAGALSAFRSNALRQANEIGQQVKAAPQGNEAKGYYAGAMSGVASRVTEQSMFWEQVQFYKDQLDKESHPAQQETRTVEADQPIPPATEENIVANTGQQEVPPVPEPASAQATESVDSTVASEQAITQNELPKPEEKPVEPIAPTTPQTEAAKPTEPTDPKEALQYSSARAADQLTSLVGVMRSIENRGTPMNREAVTQLSSAQENLLQFANNPDRDSSQLSTVMSGLDRAMRNSLDAGARPNRETPQALRYLADTINEYGHELRKTVSWALENETDPNKKAELEQTFNQFRNRLEGQVNYLYQKSEMAKRLTGG
jgi:hypothetical protein